MLYVKAMHIVAMVSWFAGIFYLPRLYVYHAMVEDGPGHERFCVMERKLLWGIMAPSAVVTLWLGTWLAMNLGWQGFALAHWLHGKLVLVALVVGYHGLCIRYQRAFAAGRNRHSHRFYRYFNEVPVLALVGIVILVVVKPG